MKRGAAGPVLFGPCFLSSDELEYLESDAADIEETLVQFTVKVKKPRINVENFDSVDVDGESKSGEAGELPPGLSAMNGEISIKPFVFHLLQYFGIRPNFFCRKEENPDFMKNYFRWISKLSSGRFSTTWRKRAPPRTRNAPPKRLPLLAFLSRSFRKRFKKNSP